VIEDIEPCRSKLERRHIEVGAMRHIETVPGPSFRRSSPPREDPPQAAIR